MDPQPGLREGEDVRHGIASCQSQRQDSAPAPGEALAQPPQDQTRAEHTAQVKPGGGMAALEPVAAQRVGNQGGVPLDAE